MWVINCLFLATFRVYIVLASSFFFVQLCYLVICQLRIINLVVPLFSVEVLHSPVMFFFLSKVIYLMIGSTVYNIYDNIVACFGSFSLLWKIQSHDLLNLLLCLWCHYLCKFSSFQSTKLVKTLTRLLSFLQEWFIKFATPRNAISWSNIFTSFVLVSLS